MKLNKKYFLPVSALLVCVALGVSYGCYHYILSSKEPMNATKTASLSEIKARNEKKNVNVQVIEPKLKAKSKSKEIGSNVNSVQNNKSNTRSKTDTVNTSNAKTVFDKDEVEIKNKTETKEEVKSQTNNKLKLVTDLKKLKGFGGKNVNSSTNDKKHDNTQLNNENSLSPIIKEKMNDVVVTNGQKGSVTISNSKFSMTTASVKCSKNLNIKYNIYGNDGVLNDIYKEGDSLIVKFSIKNNKSTDLETDGFTRYIQSYDDVNWYTDKYPTSEKNKVTIKPGQWYHFVDVYPLNSLGKNSKDTPYTLYFLTSNGDITLRCAILD